MFDRLHEEVSETHLVPAELFNLLVVSGKDKQERKTRTDRCTEEGKITRGVVCIFVCGGDGCVSHGGWGESWRGRGGRKGKSFVSE